MTYQAEGAIVDCLPSIIFANVAAAADFAAAMNLGSAARLGGKLDIAQVVDAETAEAIDPLDLVCTCGHEKYRHSSGGSCTARKCRCFQFSLAPTQPDPKAKTEPAKPAVVLNDEERKAANIALLENPLESGADLMVEIAYSLNQLLMYGKRGVQAPKDVGLAGYMAIKRFTEEYGA
jgi:hypothetical protein